MKTNFLVVLLAIFTMATAAFPQKNADSVQPPRVGYCEAVRNADAYANKEILISATYLTGFEASIFVSDGCPERSGEIWVEYAEELSFGDSRARSVWRTFENSKTIQSVEGVFKGQFRTGGGFGHMNARNFEFTISTVESAELLPRLISGCGRVDPTKEHHYLEYIKTSAGPMPDYGDGNRAKWSSAESLGWLRLVNNSTCSILVPVAGKVVELRDDGEYPVMFRLDAGFRSSYMSLGSKDVVPFSKAPSTSALLGPGKSIRFAVPRRVLKRSGKTEFDKDPYNIGVAFAFDGRAAEASYDPFFFQDFPQN